MKAINFFLFLSLFVFVAAPVLAQRTAGLRPELRFDRYNGVNGNYETLPVLEGDTLGEINFRGFLYGKYYHPGTRILSYISGPTQGTTFPADMVFMTGTPKPKMRMTIIENGNVGINTYKPQQLLTLAHGQEPIFRFDRFDSAELDYEIYNGTGGTLFFRGGADGVGTDLTDFMVLTDIGYLGLGTTTPKQLMTISAPTSPVFRYEQSNAGEMDYELYAGNQGTLFFRGGADGTGAALTDYMVLTGAGHLGLGTTTPDQLMTISHTTAPVFRFDRSGGGAEDFELYTGNSGSLFFRGGADDTGGGLTDFMTLTREGRLGIGTTTPSRLLTVSSENEAAMLLERTASGAADFELLAGAADKLYFRSGFSPLMTLTNTGELGIGTINPAQELTIADTDEPGLRLERGANDMELIMDNTNHLYFNSGATNLMVLKNSGKLAIGTQETPASFGSTDLTHYTLFASGGILTEEIRVKTAWADYVFDDDYKLSSLDKVEQFISENGHLPDMPSAKEVEENGLELKANAINQQVKIEELFLYLFDIKKEMESLRVENKELKERLGKVEQAQR